MQTVISLTAALSLCDVDGQLPWRSVAWGPSSQDWQAQGRSLEVESARLRVAGPSRQERLHGRHQLL